jgi:predicted transcriptional regulator
MVPESRKEVFAMSKAMTLRLQDELARELEAIARVEDITVSEAVRQAITEHVQAKRSDRAFQERLDRFMNENQAILERLAR